MIRLEFQNPDVKKGLRERFNRLFEKALKKLASKKSIANAEGYINIALVDDEEIRLINAKYRNIDKPTDVVSLSYVDGTDFPGENMMGEIFISTDTAAIQAEEYDLSYEEELDFLFIHGVLHVFGYDHMDEKEKKAMFQLQAEILNQA